jgi:hypothetical protein
MTNKPTPLIKVGDKIMFSDAPNGISTAHVGYVTKVGRVWIDVVHQNRRTPAGRFRMDTQRTGGSSLPGRFWTMDQYAAAMRERADLALLRDQGIRLEPPWACESPWTTSTLAAALRLAQSIGDPKELLSLIEDYGMECAYGGAGYTSDGSDALMTEIKKRLGITDDKAA